MVGVINKRMIISPTYHFEETFPRRIRSHSKYDGRFGFWADVTAVDSNSNSCTVINDQGIEIPGIQVAAREWVAKETNKDYASCERKLPPIGARVFVITPDGNIANALILCSGYPLLETDVQTLWANTDPSTQEGQETIQRLNRIGEEISQGGWHKVEFYDTGNSSIVSNDGKIALTINPAKNEDEEQEKEIVLNAWDNIITINPDGIDIEDKSGNKIEATADGLKITDKNANVINMTSSNIQIVADHSKKIKIANGETSLQSLLSDLLNKLNGGTVATQGSSSAQTVTAGQFTDEVTKLGKILE